MASNKSRINKPSRNQGSNISISEPQDYNALPPTFSLAKLINGDYCLSQLQQQDKAAFADAIFRRKTITWAELISCGRHALGYEKISRDSINVEIPKHITEDVTHFLAFRFSGTKPMVGIRTKDIFYVLWFDHNFSLYNH